MESAPLTNAHAHVRTAATATLDNSIATAGHAHDLAAAAFHDAAHDTHNAEALRILGLLHDHHRKLAGLIKEAPRAKDQKTTTPVQPAHASSASSPASRRRLPQSSIATNLAEKRGIPSARRNNTTATTGPPRALLRNEQPTPARDLVDRPSKQNTPPRQQKDATPTPASPAEDNFRRFYSAFGGVISAISAPLAFTSLPLNIAPPTPVPEPPQAERAPKTRSRNHSPEASRTVKSSVPDLAALISKPALRALRDGSSQVNPFANNESFYLVPTSSGTVTYASILHNSQAPALHSIDEATDSLKGSSHEEFVDARESINPPSPIISRRPGSRGNNSTASTTTTTTTTGVTSQRSIPAGRGSGLKTLEELSLENETLKALVDKQAKRIQMWETNSQNQFNALAQSFRTKTLPPNHLFNNNINNNNNNNMIPTPTPTQDDETLQKISSLESLVASQSEKLSAALASNQLLARQNEKNALVIARYREQWEKLKAGARRKELERKGGMGGRNGVESGSGGDEGERERERERDEEKQDEGEEGNEDGLLHG